MYRLQPFQSLKGLQPKWNASTTQFSGGDPGVSIPKRVTAKVERSRDSLSLPPTRSFNP